jgi:hypothetical protein
MARQVRGVDAACHAGRPWCGPREDRMLADLTLLLHEVTDALRGRGSATPMCESPRETLATPPTVVVVTGTISPGKARLLAALERELTPHGIAIASPDRGSFRASPALHVHAEADIDALLETNPGSEGAWARRADLLVPVDWEATSQSVRRVIAALHARGVAFSDAGV